MHHVNADTIAGLKLPGRVWSKLIGPEDGGCQNMVLGRVTFPPGSNPGPHKHDREEEVCYVLSGTGESRVGERTIQLKPGDAVYIEPGVEHGCKNTGTEPLVMISIFSPPVKPGSYDKKPS